MVQAVGSGVSLGNVKLCHPAEEVLRQTVRIQISMDLHR